MRTSQATTQTGTGDLPRLHQIGLTVLLCIGLVLIGYFYIDRPLAWLAYDHHLRRFLWLKYFTYLPDLLAFAATPILLLTPLAIRLPRLRGHGPRTLLAMSLSLSVAVFIKNALKIIFGRAWPETWINHNLSLIQNHVYGFFWFQNSQAYHSFPSGHTTITFAAMSVLWLSLPRWRWLATLICLLVIIGLLGMDYHFFSDIVAGAFLGSWCGLYVQRLMVHHRTSL